MNTIPFFSQFLDNLYLERNFTTSCEFFTDFPSEPKRNKLVSSYIFLQELFYFKTISTSSLLYYPLNSSQSCKYKNKSFLNQDIYKLVHVQDKQTDKQTLCTTLNTPSTVLKLISILSFMVPTLLLQRLSKVKHGPNSQHPAVVGQHFQTPKPLPARTEQKTAEFWFESANFNTFSQCRKRLKSKLSRPSDCI